MKVYERRVNAHRETGTVEIISVKAGLDEINHAMMGGRKNVARMSSISRTDYHIVYRNGDVVELRQIEQVEQPEQAKPAGTGPDNWTVTSHRAVAGHKALVHNFTQADADGRAICNKGFRPHRYGNGYDFKTKAEQQSDKYADLYRICPRCDAKS